MCCSPKKNHKTETGFGNCCCGFTRRFITKKEKLQRLEDYKEQLSKELAGVNEHLQEMKGE